MNELTADRLRELLHYDPETGVFTRRLKRGGYAAGSRVGYTAPDGRVLVSVDNKNFRAHRLVWLYVHGEWPSNDVDHINGDPSDNRLCNLRDVPHMVNLQNRVRPTRANRHGLIGVTKNHDRFMAQIKIDGRRVYIGTYDTPEEASAAYLEAKRKHHPGCTI